VIGRSTRRTAYQVPAAKTTEESTASMFALRYVPRRSHQRAQKVGDKSGSIVWAIGQGQVLGQRHTIPGCRTGFGAQPTRILVVESSDLGKRDRQLFPGRGRRWRKPRILHTQHGEMRNVRPHKVICAWILHQLPHLKLQLDGLRGPLHSCLEARRLCAGARARARRRCARQAMPNADDAGSKVGTAGAPFTSAVDERLARRHLAIPQTRCAGEGGDRLQRRLARGGLRRGGSIRASGYLQRIRFAIALSAGQSLLARAAAKGRRRCERLPGASAFSHKWQAPMVVRA